MKTLKLEFKCQGKDYFILKDTNGKIGDFKGIVSFTGKEILENVKIGDIVKIELQVMA